MSLLSVLKLSPSCPNPRQREKIELNFYFHTSLWCLKRCYESVKGLLNLFEEPQRTVQIKILLNFHFNTTFWNTQGGRVNIKNALSVL